MLDMHPELGPLFRFDDVLGNFGWFVWEQFLAGHHDVVHRSCDYVEWLLGDCAPELAELAVRRVFKGKDWSAEVGDWIGPRTRAELRRTDWAPQTLR
jgi:hypothetical protein